MSFEVGDARSLPVDPASVDVAVAGLVLNFVPRPRRPVGEMARVTRPGGLVAAYVWDHADGMQLIRYFRDAAVALDPQPATSTRAVGLGRTPAFADTALPHPTAWPAWKAPSPRQREGTLGVRPRLPNPTPRPGRP